MSNDIKITLPEVPDYEGAVDESYKAQKEEMERQQKIADRQQRVAILGDMARLFVDNSAMKGGSTLIERRKETEIDKAMKRKEELMQKAGAMKAQYAKDRMAAKHSKYSADMQIAQMNQSIAEAQASENRYVEERDYNRNRDKEEKERAEQAQENWQKQFDANQEWQKKNFNLRAAKVAARQQNAANNIDYRNVFFEAINADPELRGRAMVDVLDKNGFSTGEKQLSYNDAEMIAREYLYNKSMGKYDKAVEEPKL